MSRDWCARPDPAARLSGGPYLNLCFEADGCLQGVGDEARLFCARQQTPGLVFVTAGRYLERCVNQELRELGDVLYPVENSLDVAAQRDPGKLRGARNPPKGENETVGNCSDQ